MLAWFGKLGQLCLFVFVWTGETQLTNFEEELLCSWKTGRFYESLSNLAGKRNTEQSKQAVLSVQEEEIRPFSYH